MMLRHPDCSMNGSVKPRLIGVVMIGGKESDHRITSERMRRRLKITAAVVPLLPG
jgi:hypothetical protein